MGRHIWQHHDMGGLLATNWEKCPQLSGHEGLFVLAKTCQTLTVLVCVRGMIGIMRYYVILSSTCPLHWLLLILFHHPSKLAYIVSIPLA